LLCWRLGHHIDELITLFERYGFRSWLRELTGEESRVPAGDTRVAPEAARPQAPAHTQYEMETEWDGLQGWLDRARAAPCVALDTETTSLEPMLARLVGIRCVLRPAKLAISLLRTAGHRRKVSYHAAKCLPK